MYQNVARLVYEGAVEVWTFPTTPDVALIPSGEVIINVDFCELENLVEVADTAVDILSAVVPANPKFKVPSLKTLKAPFVPSLRS